MKKLLTAVAICLALAATAQQKKDTATKQPTDTTVAIVMTMAEFRSFKAFIDNTSNAPNLELKKMLAWIESRRRIVPQQKQ